MNSLREKAANGAAWSAIDNLASLGISFLVGIILARLLSPDEYGLIGIITIFTTIFTKIVDSGFTNALIRKIDATDEDYNTVLITNVTISIILYLVLFISSSQIASFFDRPQLTSLTRVMSLIIIINSFVIVQKARLTKRIDFKTQTKISLIASIASGVLGITMALKGLGVWSLVGQQLSREFFNASLLWIYGKWKPTIIFSYKSFKELFGFGWKLLVSTLIGNLWQQGYKFVIGKFYAPVTLGLYTRAEQFSSLFSSNLTGVVQRVSYPVLSSIQNDPIRLKNVYKRVIKSTMLLTFFCMLMLIAVAKPLILVLLGEKWSPCVPFLQIVSLQMMLYPLHAINLNMLQVQGRSDLFLRLEILKRSIAIIPIILGVLVDIYWMLWGSVIIGFVDYYLNAFYSGKLLGYSMWQQIKDIIPDFLVAGACAGIVYLLVFVCSNNLFLLVSQILLGLIMGIILCECFGLQEYLELKEVVVDFYKKLTNKHER